jgi:hypothetical protein
MSCSPTSNRRTSVSLFLPRVEVQHVEKSNNEHVDYITEAFFKAGYGVVSKIFPLEKTDHKTGRKYYSAIVHFEKWFYSEEVSNFILNIEATKLGNKFVHNAKTGQYWFVQKHVDNREERLAQRCKQLAEESEIEQAIRAEEKAMHELAAAARRKEIWNEMRAEELKYEQMLNLV